MTSNSSGASPAACAAASTIVSTGTRVSSKKGTDSSPASGFVVGTLRVCAAMTCCFWGASPCPWSMTSPRFNCALSLSMMRRSLFCPNNWRLNHSSWCRAAASSWLRPTTCSGANSAASSKLSTRARICEFMRAIIPFASPLQCVSLCIRHHMCSVLVTSSHHPRLDAFEQQLQPRPVHLLGRHAPPVRHEAPSLQTLRPHTKSRAIPVQHLDLRAASVDEGVQPAAHRVFAQLLARQRVQPVEGPTQVHRPTVQVHAHLSLGEEHQPLTRCNVNPPPRSSLNSTGAPRADSPLRAPRSTNAGSLRTAR